MIFIQVIIVLIVLGILWYFLEPYVKEPFKQFAIVVAVLGFCLWLLSAFNIINLPIK